MVILLASGYVQRPRNSRAHNMMTHVCVAVRIGDGKAPGEGNSHSIAKTSNEASADSDCNPFGLARVLAHGVVESPLLRMTKPRDFLLALSQNRDSASRVSLCYGLLVACPGVSRQTRSASAHEHANTRSR